MMLFQLSTVNHLGCLCRIILFYFLKSIFYNSFFFRVDEDLCEIMHFDGVLLATKIIPFLLGVRGVPSRW